MSYLLTDMLRLVRDELMDAGEASYTDAEITAAIEQTLWDISDAKPYEVLETVTLTSSSPFIDISTITDLIDVVAAYYPITATYEYWKEKRNVTRFANTIRIEMDARPSGSSEQAYLECEKRHTLTELTSTLTPDLERILVMGAAARAAFSWTGSMVSKIKDTFTHITSAITAIGNMSARITQAYNVDLVAGNTAAALVKTIITDARTEINKVTVADTGDLVKARTQAGLIAQIILDARTEINKATAASTGDLALSRTAITLVPALLTGANSANAEILLANAELDKATVAETGDLTVGRTKISATDVYGAIDDRYKYAMGDVSAAQGYLGTASGLLRQAQAGLQNANTDLNVAASDYAAARVLFDQASANVRDVSAYAQIANQELSAAERLFGQARANAQEISSWSNLCAHELSVANSYLNQAGGYIRAITSNLNTVRVTGVIQTWAQLEQRNFKQALASVTKQRTYQLYPRD